jgi:hypothetical protein
MDQEQKDTYHLIVIWMTHYCKDYWKTKLLFCNVITIAFVLSIPQQKKANIFTEHSNISTLQATHPQNAS